MSIQKDGKTYYNYEEMITITDNMIEEDAKEFAREVIRRQKEIAHQNKMYV